MKNEIIEKLNNFLSTHNPLTEECQVLYLMVQIRKILDYLDDKTYSILRFYCDWAVHTKKSHTEPIREVIERIEGSINKGRAFGKQFLADNSSPFEFMGLIELQREMESFFKDVALPEAIFQNSNWSDFRHLLLRILANQPITDPTSNIAKVYFLTASKGAGVLMVEFKDGKSYRFVNRF